MTRYRIPEPARSILQRLAPAMVELWGPDGFAIGGGTALAARWSHRTSTDIDITLDAGAFSCTKDRLLAALKEAEVRHLASGHGWLTGGFPEGEFSVATTPPLLMPALVGSSETDWGILLESTAEILARKLRLRMYRNGDFVTRDFYDICTAAEQDPRALDRALETLTEKERKEIASEVAGMGSRANRLGRPLKDIHRPDWLPDLAWRTAQLIRSGPSQEPTPEDKRRRDDPFAIPDPFKPPSAW